MLYLHFINVKWAAEVSAMWAIDKSVAANPVVLEFIDVKCDDEISIKLFINVKWAAEVSTMWILINLLPLILLYLYLLL